MISSLTGVDEKLVGDTRVVYVVYSARKDSCQDF